ncbi:MAG: glyoxalase [Robiginitomaculum sp.]|nr:MAG: glyoxalase [Robiginitomaculum sp.]
MFSSVDVSVFLATTKRDACLNFFTKSLGLTLREENEYALVFDLKGVELRISKVSTFVPMPFTVLDWQVVNIYETMDLLENNKVRFEIFDKMEMDARCVWTSPDGTRIAWFKDPDGNILSISQRP